MRGLPQSNVIGGEIGVSTRLIGRSLFKHKKHPEKRTRAWHSAYGYPTVGASVLWTETGNTPILGYAWGVFGHMRVPVFRAKRFGIHYKMGYGYGWLTKTFHPTDNHKNIAISTRGNALIHMGLHVGYTFWPVSAYLDVSFTHFSNGAWKLPNLGLNLPYLGLGVKYNIASGESMDALNIPDIYRNRPLLVFETFATMGFRDPPGHEADRAPAYNWQNRVRWDFGPRSALSAGLDLMLNLSNRAAAEQADPSVTTGDLFQVGVTLGYHQVFNRLSMVFINGIYLNQPPGIEHFSYTRIGGCYTMPSGVLLLWNLKSHLAKADHIQVGIGYRFKLKERPTP